MRTPQDEIAPKNGPLTLAVAAVLILMSVLVAANLRLIWDPSMAIKVFGPSTSSRPRPAAAPALSVESSKGDSEPCYVPPQVTFYRQLTTADERPEMATTTTGNETVNPEESASVPHGTKPVTEPKKRDTGSASCARSPVHGEVLRLPMMNLPQARPGRKRYTVQVGAFTNPRIAKEWALKWKARGHAVTLKPVARPRTGVIYRLYLGSFTSEKKADQLVKKLKSREGINALRLVLRN